METASCHAHPDREAAATCAGCGRPVCEECLAPGTTPPTCLECVIAEEGRRAATAGRGPAPPSRSTRTRGALSPATVAVLAVGLVVLAVELAVLLLMRPSPTPPGPPEAPSEKTATAQDVADIIVVREAVEGYRREHGSYPPSLESIADALPPELAAQLKRKAVVYEVGKGHGYRLRYTRADGPPLVLESDRNVIVTEEVTP